VGAHIRIAGAHDVDKFFFRHWSPLDRRLFAPFLAFASLRLR
jgi:hypothetical protein